MAEHHELDFDKIVALLKGKGINAYVEQTGGGTATIYAGELKARGKGAAIGAEKVFDDDRWDASAGPGWFAGPGWTRGRGGTEEFYVGPDDDGEADPVAADESWDEQRAADEIAKVVAK
jgi:hypothetical protein